MAEEKENLVTVKAFHEDREWIKDEQERLRKARGGDEPTQGEIIHAMIEHYKSAGAKPHALPAVAPKGRDAQWHAMLDEILADKEERIGIEKNLHWAIDSIRKKPSAKRKPA